MNVLEIMRDHDLDKRYAMRQAGGDEYWGFCPWCQNAASLMLDPVKNTWQCHKCGRRGGPVELDAHLRRERQKQHDVLLRRNRDTA